MLIPNHPSDKTLKVEHLLEQSKPRDFVSYESLTRAIGAMVDGVDGRHYLNAARNRLLRKGVVFVVRRGEGLVRADDGAIVAEGGERNKRSRRAARKTVRILSAAEYDRLSRDERQRYTANMAIAAVTMRMASSSSQKRLMAAAVPTVPRLTVSQTLDLFRKNGK